MTNMARALQLLYQQEGDLVVLSEAIDAYWRAVELLAGTDDRETRVEVLGNLSSAHRHRHLRMGNPDDLGETVAVAWQAASASGEDRPSWAQLLHNLAMALDVLANSSSLRCWTRRWRSTARQWRTPTPTASSGRCGCPRSGKEQVLPFAADIRVELVDQTGLAQRPLPGPGTYVEHAALAACGFPFVHDGVDAVHEQHPCEGQAAHQHEWLADLIGRRPQPRPHALVRHLPGNPLLLKGLPEDQRAAVDAADLGAAPVRFVQVLAFRLARHPAGRRRSADEVEQQRLGCRRGARAGSDEYQLFWSGQPRDSGAGTGGEIQVGLDRRVDGLGSCVESVGHGSVRGHHGGAVHQSVHSAE